MLLPFAFLPVFSCLLTLAAGLHHQHKRSVQPQILEKRSLKSEYQQHKESSNRPLIHHTPAYGWMSDPDGLFYDKKEKLWHMYYQFNPTDSVWGLPLYWGHSTSKNLTTWDFHGIAISPAHDNEGIFSGSIVIDSDNTSGLFNDSTHPDQRIVAIYTNNVPSGETQDLAYSTDGGFTFTKYEQNPVLDIHNSDFRDPKIFWHKETKQWIMTVVVSQEYKIQIYGSKNLKDWTFHSNFTGGYPGFQFECPVLERLPINNSGETKWVMFLAINPGSPSGGPVNQYFIGDFDGKTFTPIDDYTRFVDLGKDYYALNTFSGAPEEDGVLGVAWSSNWQYSSRVPTSPWRGQYSSIRNFTLEYVDVNPSTKRLSLMQSPVMKVNTSHESTKQNYQLNTNNPFSLQTKDTGVFDFDITLKVAENKVTKSDDTNFQVKISSSDDSESIKIGFDPVGQAFYVDRGINTKNFDTRLFTDKMTTYINRWYLDSEGRSVYKIYGVVDKNIVEVYFNNGSTTMTNIFFMSEGNSPSKMEVSCNYDNIFYVEKATLRELSA